MLDVAVALFEGFFVFLLLCLVFFEVDCELAFLFGELLCPGDCGGLSLLKLFDSGAQEFYPLHLLFDFALHGDKRIVGVVDVVFGIDYLPAYLAEQGIVLCDVGGSHGKVLFRFIEGGLLLGGGFVDFVEFGERIVDLKLF